MGDDLKRLQDALARQYLGKGGIHALNVDGDTGTVNVYLDEGPDTPPVMKGLRRKCGGLKVNVVHSPPSRLA